MDQNTQMLELMKKIEKSNRTRNFLSVVQCVLMLVATACCVVVMLQVLTILPEVNSVINQMQTVLGNLEETTDALASLDLAGMIADVDTLVVTGQQSLEQTMAKLNSIDFDTLNQAIKDLAAVVQPLAKLTKVFG